MTLSTILTVAAGFAIGFIVGWRQGANHTTEFFTGLIKLYSDQNLRDDWERILIRARNALNRMF